MVEIDFHISPQNLCKTWTIFSDLSLRRWKRIYLFNKWKKLNPHYLRRLLQEKLNNSKSSPLEWTYAMDVLQIQIKERRIKNIIQRKLYCRFFLTSYNLHVHIRINLCEWIFCWVILNNQIICLVKYTIHTL